MEAETRGGQSRKMTRAIHLYQRKAFLLGYFLGPFDERLADSLASAFVIDRQYLQVQQLLHVRVFPENVSLLVERVQKLLDFVEFLTLTILEMTVYILRHFPYRLVQTNAHHLPFFRYGHQRCSLIYGGGAKIFQFLQRFVQLRLIILHQSDGHVQRFVLEEECAQKLRHVPYVFFSDDFDRIRWPFGRRRR